VQRAERADRPPITAANLVAIQGALEQAGIVFYRRRATARCQVAAVMMMVSN
jgi:hypothetical protein